MLSQSSMTDFPINPANRKTQCSFYFYLRVISKIYCAGASGAGVEDLGGVAGGIIGCCCPALGRMV